ncbi:MAG: penicillin acylase family protein [Bacteroidota bacterium]
MYYSLFKQQISRYYYLVFLSILTLTACNAPNSVENNQVNIQGLQSPVEIIRDKWGINHIYADNQHDLFFAQGYAAAKDRLFQFEIWRRQATGTVAEILGERELERDIGTRLFQFRGDMTEEMNYYHEDGADIITAYTDGVNAYIDEILKTPDRLPLEFKLLDIQPQKWTPAVVISRHQGLLGNIKDELAVARSVAKLGVDKVKEILWFHPKDPILDMDPAIDQERLFDDDILAPYLAYRKRVTFLPEDVVAEYRRAGSTPGLSVIEDKDDPLSIGSNNWVVSGALTTDGHTYMANDPHRTIAVPSLRYMAHLVAPGWNVIGGGEPEIPGISIGHNEYGAWGLTVFRTDGEDLYVYDLNPDNLSQYRYQDEWVDMQRITETIPVKGQASATVDLHYTRHGPVTYIDSTHLKAYAVRCAWLEPGGSPYLASLRMDQAKNWEEFRAACNYSHIPGENMVWADRAGNIGWQAVGIAPIRRNFSGFVPVPGDGRYEWDGYLPIIEKPHEYNPDRGFIATANQNVTPPEYDKWEAIGYSWSDPFRGDRVTEVLTAKTKLELEDMRQLQVDYHSIPARLLVPLLDNISFEGSAAKAKSTLTDWNYELLANSIAAGIYVAWENRLKEKAEEQFIPAAGKDYVPGLQMNTVVRWLTSPDQKFGTNPTFGRDRFLVDAFNDAIAELEERLGKDQNQWQYGQAKYKHTKMYHALTNAVNEETKQQLNLGPLPRGGNAYTPGSTGGNDRQSSGGTFRIIVNTGDWDACIGTNAPGQSGDPNSPFYNNLFESWAKDEFFPVYFSRKKIEINHKEELLLMTK